MAFENTKLNKTMVNEEEEKFMSDYFSSDQEYDYDNGDFFDEEWDDFYEDDAVSLALDYGFEEDELFGGGFHKVHTQAKNDVRGKDKMSEAEVGRKQAEKLRSLYEKNEPEFINQ